MASSSKGSDSSSQRSEQPDQGMGGDAAAASVAIHGKVTQLVRQIQHERLAYIKEKLEVNRKTLQRHTCELFDVAAAAEVASRGTEGCNALSQRAAEGQSRPVGPDLANRMGERDVVYVQEENPAAGTLVLSGSGGAAQRTVVRFVKLPLIERIPPYTTWIFLDKYGAVAPLLITYFGNEALICSDSDDEIPEPEEEKHFFTEGEDQLIWKATQEHGLNREVVNVLCQFVDATPSEIEERSEILFEKNEKNSGSSDKIRSQLSLDKTMDAVLDSFDNLFCRRCLVFDCRLHGCSQNLVFPCEKQPYSFELDENKRPCGDQCYLRANFDSSFPRGEKDLKEQDMAARTRIYRRRGRNRKLKYTWKSAGHPTVRKRIGDGKQWYTQYNPCGCQQTCGKDCLCVENGTCCEKYCGCSKSCKNKFRGCHCAKSQCRSRQCPCFAASRECDPDVCRNCWVSCGDGSLGEPPARGDGYQCGNMKLLLKQQQRILLGRSDVAGWGAFIKNPVSKNDYLGEYTGELISHKEADKRGKIYDRANSSFLFDLNDQYVLDAYRKGDKLKFANHSSNPNCYAKVMLVAGDHRVGIYAKEHIEASEELFYDYRYGPDQAPAWARRPEGSKKDEASVSHRRAHKVAR
nr:unnamed protein product [Digitaria exilis]